MALFQGRLTSSTNVTTGVFGQATVLDNVNDFVEVNSHASLNFGDTTNDQPFSLSIWMYMPDASDTGGVLSKASAIKTEITIF